MSLQKTYVKESKEKIEFHIRRILESFGYPYSAAILYAKLLLNEKPLTIDDLVEMTGFGKSTVSTSLRLLEHDGLIYWEKQGRKKLFHARSALIQLLLLPTKLLNEEIIPLREELERTNEIPIPIKERLMRDLEKFEEIAREIERISREYTREQ